MEAPGYHSACFSYGTLCRFPSLTLRTNLPLNRTIRYCRLYPGKRGLNLAIEVFFSSYTHFSVRALRIELIAPAKMGAHILQLQYSTYL